MSTDSHTPDTSYGKIFLALFVLTVLEIFTANLPFTRLVIILALIFLAVIKAALVAAFYMHLRFEKVLLTVIAVAPLAFSVILTMLVGFDIHKIIRP